MKITPCISPLLHLLLLYNTWGSASCQSIPPLRNVLWSDCLLCAIEVPYERRPPGLCDTAAEETGKFQWRTVILYWGLTTALIMVKLCMTFQDMRFNPLNDVKTIKSNFATNQQNYYLPLTFQAKNCDKHAAIVRIGAKHLHRDPYTNIFPWKRSVADQHCIKLLPISYMVRSGWVFL